MTLRKRILVVGLLLTSGFLQDGLYGCGSTGPGCIQNGALCQNADQCCSKNCTCQGEDCFPECQK